MNNRSLRLGYIFSLFILMLVLVINYVLINKQLDKTNLNGQLIKMVVEQRNLSHKVSLQTLGHLSGDQLTPEAISELKMNVRQLEQGNAAFLGHKCLENGIDLATCHSTMSEYLALKTAYEYIINTAKSILTNQFPKKHSYAKMIQQQSIFNDGMDSIIKEYEEEAAINIAKLKTTRLFCTLGFLLVLLLEGIFVFRPIGINIKKYIADTEHQNQQLSSRNIELVLANEKIEEAQQFFLKLSAHVPGVFYQFKLNDDGRFYFPFMSNGAINLYGIEAEKIMADANLLIRLTHPEDAVGFNEARRKSKENLTPLLVDSRVILPDGTVKWTRAQSTPERLHDGILWHGYMQDITREKERELLLAQSEKKYRSIIESSLNGFILGKDGMLIDANEAAAAMFGYDLDTFKSLKRDNIFHPEDEAFAEFRKERVKNGKAKSEIIGYKKSGEAFPCEIFSVLSTDIDGVIISISFVIDITERKNFESTLAKSQQLLSQAETMAKIGSSEVDYKTGKFFWSEEFYRIHGLKPYSLELNHENSSRFLHPDDRYKIQLMQEAAEQQNDYLEFDSRIIRADGEIRDISSLWKFAYDKDGTPLKMYGVVQDITEKKRLETALKESEQQFRGAFEYSAIGIALVNPDTTWKEVNDSLCQMIGYSKEELLTLTFKDITHPDDLATDLTLLTELLNGQRDSYKMEKRYIHKNGSIVWILLVVSITKDSQGKPLQLIAQIENITERKLAELALAKSKANHEALIDSTDDLMLSIDREYRLISFNKAFEEKMYLYYGYHIQEGDVVLPQAYHEAAAKWKIVYDRALKGEHFSYYDKTIDKTSQLYMYNLVTLNPMVNEHNEVYGVACYSKNITEQMLQQQQLEKAKNQLANIMDSSPDIICTINGAGKFVSLNKTARKIWGYEPNEMSGKPFIEYVHSDDQQKTGEITNAILQGKEVTNFENRYIRKDGTYIPIIWSARWDEATKTMYCVARDATAIKEQEKVLENLNTSLNVRAQELLESNRELERFAYVASHDLQEPLRMITSFLQLLQKKYDDQLDEKANGYINFAVDGAKRMKNLILDMLEYSRVNTNTNLQETVDLNDIYEDVVMNLSLAINNCHATVEMATALPTVLGVRSQLMQLFQNLISNAIKYRKEGRNPHVIVSCSDNHSEWEFMVKDNGIGIDAKFYDKIFIIFQRLHNKGEYSGTGIGLAICKKIVEKLGGRIWLSSQQGEGSTFYFTIPKSLD